jgi:hypothetical protein
MLLSKVSPPDGHPERAAKISKLAHVNIFYFAVTATFFINP